MNPFSASVAIASRSSRRAVGGRERPLPMRSSSSDDLARDDELRIGERIHQEDLAAVFERDTDIENRGLHGAP